MSKLAYQPKGGMCLACRHMRRNCSHLDFRSMPVLSEARPACAGHVVIVRCTAFEREEAGR